MVGIGQKIKMNSQWDRLSPTWIYLDHNVTEIGYLAI